MKNIFTILLLSFTVSVAAQNISKEATTFLQLLTPTLKANAMYALDSAERTNWTIVPRPRKGACYKAMDEKQRAAAIALLKASLSAQGYKKSFDIMKNEEVLRELDGRPADDTYRDPLNYYFTIFGDPSSTGAWGWRLEGHHISQNFFSLNGALQSSTPSAMGSNPGIVPSGPKKGTEILKQETDLGFALINSFSKEQLATAVFSDVALPEMLTLGVRDAVALEPKGLPVGKLTTAQRKLFDELLNVYISNYAQGFSKKFMDKISKGGIENLTFAWSGGTKPGTGHYYRIQGPSLLIEYDNTQNNANHVHTAVRDLTNDYGYDVLKDHYLKEHKKAGK